MSRFARSPTVLSRDLVFASTLLFSGHADVMTILTETGNSPWQINPDGHSVDTYIPLSSMSLHLAVVPTEIFREGTPHRIILRDILVTGRVEMIKRIKIQASLSKRINQAIHRGKNQVSPSGKPDKEC